MRNIVYLLLLFQITTACAQNTDEPAENKSQNSLLNKSDYTISNNVIKVGISNRDAGAVCSLVFDGKEFVNDHDHGRQLQVAWIYNGLGEDYNPTEAGSDYDQMKPTSTSQLLSVKIDGNTLKTVSHPAYWWFYGGKATNTKEVTKDSLTKVLTLGFEGDPNVLVFDTKVAVSQELTGPDINHIRIEAPTIYSNFMLSNHYLFNLDNSQLQLVPSRSPLKKDSMNERIRQITQQNQVPVMSSGDGKYALAFYTQQSLNFWAYYTWEVPSNDATNACMKMTAFFKHDAQVRKTYDYRTFVVCGSLETVKKSLLKLKK